LNFIEALLIYVTATSLWFSLKRRSIEKGGHMKSILDRSFRYTSSAQTDVRKTFARIRRELQTRAQAQARADAEAKLKVSPIRAARNRTGVRGQATPDKL
jgi:hypothetical protein